MSTVKELKERIAAAEGKAVETSLTAKSPNADKMRGKAERMLSDSNLWKRRLRNQAKQLFEYEQITAGNVSNVISDASLEYYKANRD